MPLAFRIVLLCLGVVGAGVIIRALQTGIYYGKGWTPFDRETQFGMYAIHIFANLIGVATCLWLAAGYTGQDFWGPLGLGALFAR